MPRPSSSRGFDRAATEPSRPEAPTLGVVVGNELPNDAIEVARPEDEEPVEALALDREREALGDCVHVRSFK